MSTSVGYFGAHHLGLEGLLGPDDGQLLEAAARIAAEEGCQLFELACAPVTTMSAEAVAKAITTGGIGEVSYCRFFGDDADGDPLAEGELFDKAIATFEGDVAYIEALRSGGLNVRYITGPSCFRLGKEYQLEDGVRHARLVRFAREQVRIVKGKELIVCAEYLRPSEDKGALGGVKNVLRVIDEVNSPDWMYHADAFHSIECGEDPWKALSLAGDRVGYFHTHGPLRVVPGAYCLDGVREATDTVNWHLVGQVLKSIGYTGPVVPEPFCQKIRDAVPVLGEGLPPAIDPRRFYHLAGDHLRHEGVIA